MYSTLKYKNHIINEYSKIYKTNNKETVSIVNNSTFNEMLTEDPEFVMHYNVCYWTKDIYDEFIECNQTRI
jgi:hypothetical protein